MRLLIWMIVCLITSTGFARADTSCSDNTPSCNACSISCPTGQAAVCSPGRAIWNGSAFVCQAQPRCSCQRQ